MAEGPLERRLLAIVAADVVGYSRMMEADEPGTIARLQAVRAELIDPLIARHHGRIVKLMGDGALLVFESVVDAVACAVAIQTAVVQRNAGLPDAERIVFRVGVNLGDVALVDGDVYGDGVNIAARLEQLCEPGGVTVSGTVYDHLQGKLDLALEFRGEQHVKNIGRLVRIYSVRLDGMRPKQRWAFRALPRRMLAAVAAVVLLSLAGGLWWLWPAERAHATKPAIAVLPFDSLGGDETTGRLADGITEDIITDLARYTEFEVIARNSTGIYKGRPVDVRQVGQDLGVGYVLEGSIQRDGERLRATAQLIDAGTATHIWSERWDRPAGAVFAMQTEIAEQVANRIGGGTGLIQKAGRKAARRKPPEDLGAYELYLLGVERLQQLTRESVAEALRLLTRATEADPNLARAWVDLSWAHSLTGRYGGDRAATLRAATDAAQRAVRLDPSDAGAHAVLGHMLAKAGDLVRGEAELDEALTLNPGSADILTIYAGWASGFGKPGRGAEAADKAIRLNPSYQPWQANFFSPAYFMAGRHEEALRTLGHLAPENWNRTNIVVRLAVLGALGRAEEARATVGAALARYPDLSIEGHVSSPEFNDTERRSYIEALRAAGLRPCARPEELASFANPIRLPECVSK
jgi:TolB-like protein/class 3 adenylate cyclase